jgi:hypothetical protein
MASPLIFGLGSQEIRESVLPNDFFLEKLFFFKKKQEQKGWGCRASQVGAATSRGFLRNVVAYL